jgi:hypothetical protein
MTTSPLVSWHLASEATKVYEDINTSTPTQYNSILRRRNDTVRACSSLIYYSYASLMTGRINCIRWFDTRNAAPEANREMRHVLFSSAVDTTAIVWLPHPTNATVPIYAYTCCCGDYNKVHDSGALGLCWRDTPAVSRPLKVAYMARTCLLWLLQLTLPSAYGQHPHLALSFQLVGNILGY